MRRWAIPAAGLAAILGGAPLLAAPRAEVLADGEVRALLQQRLEMGGGSGAIVVALLGRGGTRFVAVGRSGNPARPQADEDTLFQIGSITKTFTAFLLAEAVKRGEVKLDDRLDRTLGDRTGTRDDGAGSATLLELATHTSGLPRVPVDAAFLRSVLASPRDPYRAYGEADLDRYLAGLHRSPERSFDYSNLGFALLGKALERAAGEPYPDLIRERVTGPLGLGDTHVGLPDALRDRAALGYDPNGDRTPAWTPGAFAPAGAIWSTARDLARYLDAMRDGKAPAQPSVLAVHAHRDEGRDLGLGWVLESKHGDDLCWHNGGTGGFRSFAGFSRKSGLGAVVLSSSEHDVTDLGHHLLNGAYRVDRPRASLMAKLVAAAAVLLVVLRLVRVGRRPGGGLAGWIGARRGQRAVTADEARKSPGRLPGRADAVVGVLGAVAVIALGWHLVPWMEIGGRAVRLAIAVAVVVASIVSLVKARALPWFAAPGLWPRVRVGLRAVLGVGMLLLAARWW